MTGLGPFCGACFYVRDVINQDSTASFKIADGINRFRWFVQTLE